MEDKKPVVLVVDDTPSNLDVIISVLEDEDYHIIVALDGVTAFSRVVNMKPDLILLDVMMPEMNGFEVCEKLKKDESTRDIPVIFMTALSDTVDKLRGFELGAVDYITKPFHHAEMLARIKTHLKLRELTEELKTINVGLEERVRQRTLDLELANEKLKKEIADRIEAERQREELAERLLHSQRLNALAQLAAGIAHDYKNQLNMILSSAELLDIQARLRESEKELLRGIIQTAVKGEKLTRRLLDFGRKKEMEVLELFDLHELVEQTVGVLRGAMHEKIKITTTFEAKNPNVEIDVVTLQNAIVNLAINARDAMPDGGALNFKTLNFDVTDESRVNYDNLDPGEYIQLEVSDTGCGLPDEIRQHLFEPFHSTKGAKGTGLGLASIHGCVKAHSGYIEVQSEPGKGCRFTILLPTSTRSNEKVERVAKDETVKRVESIGANVLIVDDEEVLRNSMTTALSMLGYEAKACETVDEALKYFTKHHDKLDLTIIDMFMPTMNGLELFEELRKIDPDASVLIASGCVNQSLEEEILKMPVKGMLRKPFKLNELSQTIEDIIGS